jgi:hypothetical protein
VPRQLGAGLFLPNPVLTLAQFLHRCSVLLFSFDLVVGASLRAKKNSSRSRSSALIFSFSHVPLLRSMFMLRFLARSARRFMFVLSTQCSFRSVPVSVLAPHQSISSALFSFSAVGSKLELFLHHCPVLFDSHCPGCWPRLLLLVVDFAARADLRLPLCTTASYGSKVKLLILGG